ncbi:trypsin-like peptidase domain-containing protein [Streptomyces sp. NPDC005955]|uniref:trypsin-like peptidase domain-containing protein n=1 Tax=Streptomyces sp. NPDC005955 TaxID=3364738 RepID=UPI0036A16280
MDEGKPKWWSRPAPAAPGEGTATPVPAPAPGTPPEDAPGDRGGAAEPRPDAHPVDLTKPPSPRPVALPDTATGQAAQTAAAQPPAAAPEPPAERRPVPLHAPDPYGTPPYGQPGPWAPAPPVQHPAATPAHGVPTIPAQGPAAGPPSYGTSPPGAAAAPHGTQPPAGAVPPGPVPPGGVPHGTPGHGTPTHGAAAPYGPPSGHPRPQGGPGPEEGAGGPWARYDPWAGAPLQPVGDGTRGGAGPRTGAPARRGLLVGALVLGLAAGAVGGVTGAYFEARRTTRVELPQAAPEPRDRAPDSVAGIAARSLPGVVTLHVRGGADQGTGTGFVLDGRGHILTNNHVVEPAGAAGEITVTFSTGEVAEAEIVGRDTGYDLAVVKVTGVAGLKPLPLGNSDDVRVGDPVVAIGAPFDLANTVTSGIISATERPITAGGEKGDGSDVSYVDALQTDAPINPGNSGGPLMDSRARVIGINSAIRSADGGDGAPSGQSGSIGLGFAIPVNQGKRVAEELINTGKATHPIIGVTLDMDYTGDGARVGSEGNDGAPAVVEDGPGARAGIRPGDVITEVDDQRVRSGEELIVKIRAHRPGDRLQLTLERGGREHRVTLVLGSATGG